MNTIHAQTQGLDIEGKSIFGDLVTIRKTIVGSSNINNVSQANLKNLVVDRNGVILSAIKGSPLIVGGYRPRAQSNLFTAKTGSSITRVRYMAHIDQSSVTNNAILNSYAYGDLTIVFMNGQGKIVNMTCFNAIGDPKSFTSVAPTGNITDQRNIPIDFQGTFNIVVRSDGTIGVAGVATTVSYIFEFMGGI